MHKITFLIISVLFISCSSKEEKVIIPSEKMNFVPSNKFPNVICDLDGDKRNDTVSLINNIENKKSGLKIQYANGKVDYLGMGKKIIGQNFDNFDWIGVFEKADRGKTYWSNVNDEGEVIIDSNEVAPSDRITLKNDGIFVHASESCGGGIIYYKNKKYNWIQQE